MECQPIQAGTPCRNYYEFAQPVHAGFGAPLFSLILKVGLPVLVLLKLTTKGAQPAESEIVKSATGACPKSRELVSNKRITHALAINSDVFSVTDLLFSLN